MRTECFLLVVIAYGVGFIDCSSISSNPHATSIHENMNGVKSLWTLATSCDYNYLCSYTYNYECNCGGDGCGPCQGTCYDTSSCNTCKITSVSNGGGNLFFLSGFTLYKQACPDITCDNCDILRGCANAGESYDVTIQCWRTNVNSYSDYNTGYPSATKTFTFYANTPPTFYFTAGQSIKIFQNNTYEGKVINQIIPKFIDETEDNDVISYYVSSEPRRSWIHDNDLFDFNTENGEIYLSKTLEYEFSYTFDMGLCIVDRRRDTACHTLHIEMWACYQTPNCTDQEILDLKDTHGILEHNSNNSLFGMIYPTPSDHFPYFRNTWSKLTWSLDDGGFSESTIDADSGHIYLTKNISIWPAWPTKSYLETVTVSNSESCNTTTCKMRVTIHYTNWPPHIISLPAQTSLHEDNDTETLLHNLKVYDYNYDAPEDGHDIEDNITCWIKYVHDQWGENDMELFDLRLDDPNDQIRWDSYKLYKKECTVPTSQYSPPCGYKRENYTCPKHSGCMTHNVTQWYNVSIMCKDGYGAIDNRNFTFYPTRNQAPTWRNLPKHLDLDLKQGSEEDIIFSIMYQDEENENLTYEYKFMKNDGTVTAYFRGDPSGNYFNQLGNISLTTYLYDVPKNTSYTIEICGHERRNEICELLTIDLEDYCGPVPTCSSLEKTVTTEEPVPSTLFDVKTAVANYASYSNITFTLTSRSANTFEIDENTGIVTLLSTLTASYPSSTYVLNAFVRDAQSCHYYSVCPLTLHVTYVNHALKIINSVTTTAIHEDEAKTLTLFTIETSDLNDDDDVTCVMTNPSVNKPFYVTETFSTSQVYVVKNYIAGTDVTKKLSSAKTVYTLDVNCTDRYGAGEVKTFTINVALNQPPVLQQLHGLVSRNVDQSTMFSGSTLITEQAFDEERDTLVYTCYVNNSNVPLKCDVVSDTLQVKLRRNVSISSEIGDVYSMKVCVGDAKHPLADCGTLQLNFTTQHSYPSISNLPAEVEVPEDAAIGYTVFTATVSDTDIPAEIHTLFLNNTSNDTIGYFELDRYAGSITLLKALDYETKKRYTLRLTVQDPFLVSPELYKLVIKVKDVNEQNYLTAKNRSITFKENAKVGRIFHIGLECTDFDEEDTQTITIAGGDHVEYFLYNITTRKIHLAKEWDLDDSISNLPSTTTLTIRCTDSAMHTSDVDIVFNIENVNDQKPSFILDKSISNNTLSDGSVAIKVDSSTSPSEPLLTVTCVDGEKGDHGACAFSILGNGLGRRYFELRSVTTAGRRKRAGVKNSAVLYLREEMKLNYNKNFQFYVKVSDGGTPAQFTTVMLTANFTATVDPPKAAKSTTCSGSSACSTLYAILAIELAMVAGLSVYTVYSLFCKNKNKIDNLALQEAVSKDVKRRQFSNSKHRTTTFLYGETIPGKGKAGLGTFLHGPDSMPGMSTSIMARREYRTSSSSSESSSDEDDWITPTPREMPSRPQVRRIGESTRFEAPFSSNRDPTLMRHIYSSNTFLNGRLAENSNTRRSQSFSQSRDPVTGANLVKASSSLSNTDYETGLPAPIYSSDMSFRI